MKKITIIASICALTLAAASAIAYPGHTDGEHKKGKKHHKMMKKMSKMDTDQDGLISRDEFFAHAEKRFAKMDANGDNSITKEEAKAAHKAMREERKAKHEERRRQKESS